MTRCSITGKDVESVKAAGITDIKVLKHTGVMFANLTPEQMNKLRSLGCTVERVQTIKTDITVPEPKAGVQTYTPQYLSWAAGMENVHNLTEPPLQGQGMNVAIIDTGIRETHQQINGRVAYRKNYTQDPMEDGFDHGTGVASILLAVAPGCNILNLKVMGTLGEGTTEEVVEAIEDCIDLWDTNPEIAPVVINLSVGAVDIGNPNDPLRVACRAALENRIWLSAAAGNMGPEPMTIVSPAVEKYVFATGSVGLEPFKVSNFSSRGPTVEGITKPDAVFFGENIQMASSQSDTATVGKSGTSFSTPFSTGIALLYLQGSAAYGGIAPIVGEQPELVGEAPPGYYPEWEVQISLQQLIDTYLGGICLKPEGVPAGKDDDYGFGVPMGTLMASAISSIGGISLAAIIPMIMMVGMMGIMMRTVTKEA